MVDKQEQEDEQDPELKELYSSEKELLKILPDVNLGNLTAMHEKVFSVLAGHYLLLDDIISIDDIISSEDFVQKEKLLSSLRVVIAIATRIEELIKDGF